MPTTTRSGSESISSLAIVIEIENYQLHHNLQQYNSILYTAQS